MGTDKKAVMDFQDNVLSANMIKKTMPSCMVYSFVLSMAFMVDTIIAGHFLGTDAVAAIALGMPGIGIMLSLTAMILQGAFLKLLNAMGRNDMEDYHRLLTLALICTTIVDCIFISLCLFKTSAVLMAGGAGKASPQAVMLGELYLRAACLEILFFIIGSIFQHVIITYGYRTESMLCSLICVIVNLASSVCLVLVLPEGIRIVGLGIGSALGTFVQMITALIIIKQKNICLKLKPCAINRDNLLDFLDMLRRGFPSSVDNTIGSVSNSIVNRIILATFTDGTAVIALVAMIKTIYSIVRTIGRGVYFACEPMIGVLFGGKDHDGICKVFITGLIQGTAYAAGLAAILIVFRNPVLSFYKLSDNADAEIGLIIIALSGLITIIAFTFNSVYESTEHLLLSIVVSVIPDSILYPLLIPITCKAMGVTGIWISLGFNFIPFFIVYYLVFSVCHKTLPVPLKKLLALKEEGDRVKEMDVSIPTDSKNVTFVSEKLQNFLRENGVTNRVAYMTSLCTEEIAADYLLHRKEANMNKKSFMDIKVFREEGAIKIILRNYDEPYNPLLFEKEADNFRKIGITMVQKICREISHSYAYHLNVVSIVMDI